MVFLCCVISYVVSVILCKCLNSGLFVFGVVLPPVQYEVSVCFSLFVMVFPYSAFPEKIKIRTSMYM